MNERTKILNARVEPELKQAVKIAASKKNIDASAFIIKTLKAQKDIKQEYDEIVKNNSK